MARFCGYLSADVRQVPRTGGERGVGSSKVPVA